jgi:type-F conjugative transfer system secretin TraK
MSKKKFLGLGLMALVSTSAQAIQNFNLVDHQRTEIQLSNRQMNRIAVKGDRIQQVFGADEHFHIETDEHGGQIFLKFLSDQMLEPVSLTIVTEAGLTQDLTLMPDDMDAQTVLFKPGVGMDGNEENEISESREDKIVALISAMAAGDRLEGYDIKAIGPGEENESEPAFKAIKTYEGESFKGIIYCLQNAGETVLNVTEQDVALPRDLAISLSATSIAPGQSVQLYVVQAVKEAS